MVKIFILSFIFHELEITLEVNILVLFNSWINKTKFDNNFISKKNINKG